MKTSKIIVLTALLLCVGCAPKVVTVPEYHYERHNTTDTVMLHDSILRERNTIIREADSAMLSELGIRLQQGERAILVLRKELERALSQQKKITRDTIIKTDSIRVPYPVEKKLTKWQQLKIGAGEIILFVSCLIAVFLWLRFLVRRKTT
jgi:hypothetical protein